MKTAGTTAEWDAYRIAKAEHDVRMEFKKPKPEDFDGPDDFNKAYNDWLMEWSCDAPNKPGYYRANND